MDIKRNMMTQISTISKQKKKKKNYKSALTNVELAGVGISVLNIWKNILFIFRFSWYVLNSLYIYLYVYVSVCLSVSVSLSIYIYMYIYIRILVIYR